MWWNRNTKHIRADMMEWNIDISDIRGAKIEQAKVEAMRKIAEQLEKLTNLLEATTYVKPWTGTEVK